MTDMKKIIELAEKATMNHADAFSAYASYLALKEAIEHRKTLEQTPITEEWLKEHGFVVSDEIHSKRDKIYINPEHGIKAYLDVDCSEGVVGNADCIDIYGSSNQFHKENYCGHEISLSDLYDACELCGINLED